MRPGTIVERALDLGVNLVDTAEIYAYGRSERIVGEAIRGRRDEVFLATKLFQLLPLAAGIRNQLMAQDDEKLTGEVEADEAYIGGRPRPTRGAPRSS